MERFTHLKQLPLSINSCQRGPQPVKILGDAADALWILHLLANVHANPAVVHLLPANRRRWVQVESVKREGETELLQYAKVDPNISLTSVRERSTSCTLQVQST